MPENVTTNGRHRVVVIGGGFGGIQAVSRLARAPVEVTLVDRRNFHLFQPLTYQVATGALSAVEVAYPLRAIFKRRRNVRVLLGEVTGFDFEDRTVRVEPGAGESEPFSLPYDTLIVAGGSHYSYFGHDEWREVAPEVKSLESALSVRAHILKAFEAAELEGDEERQRAWLTFVVVGAGPTGVEMAGQIGELARDTLRRDFRSIDPTGARVLLIEMADRVLTTFPPSLSQRAARSLEHLGVTPLLNHTVVDIDEHSVTVEESDRGRERIRAHTVIWAAGVTASSLARRLGEATGAEIDRAGRLSVAPDLTLPGHPEVFALGDMVRVLDENGDPQPLLGVAPVAMQEGRYAAKAVKARLRGRENKPFRYRDKGNLATIGRARAVADLHAVKLSGFPAWVTWLVVHIWYLIGFQNRILVMIRWAIAFFTRGRGGRVIEELGPPGSGWNIALGSLGGVAADRKELARRFYEAFSAGDRDFYEEHLAEDFTFSAPPDPLLDREGYFERCWPGAGRGQRFDIVRLVESGDEVIVTYEAETSAGKRGRNTEVLTFDRDKVKRVEVYFGWDL